VVAVMRWQPRVWKETANVVGPVHGKLENRVKVVLTADVPLCLECCLLVEMEEDVLVRRLWFWLLVRLPGFLVAAFQYLEVALLLIFSQRELSV
jgi:hypothetical protein